MSEFIPINGAEWEMALMLVYHSSSGNAAFCHFSNYGRTMEAAERKWKSGWILAPFNFQGEAFCILPPMLLSPSSPSLVFA